MQIEVFEFVISVKGNRKRDWQLYTPLNTRWIASCTG